ncbi:hypothetical protein CPB86DRAFT_391154 [Serendipita vermifera]|nr:hypothetical protein CPB86DRAFT_391154 [Serendipita vermifera]
MVNLSNLWDNLRRSFTIRLRKTRSKGNPPSIKEVAPENDLWDALPLDDQIFFHCPKAKADAVTGISSLPVEILELILEYCSIDSARSLFFFFFCIMFIVLEPCYIYTLTACMLTKRLR